ncbi:YitT family protein [Paenactinomyces guangxiensis]|uniref:YitT family protein n=2 Tax=Paenactinomyces guangxiensis TaxID=1490290 RepID=A0A7W1WNG4_9BACL|nr:YitT family protein [Paenactinomyces guangxiensis]MBH8590148.1 YitT family protein [Paenactinomyces guangxiensis]
MRLTGWFYRLAFFFIGLWIMAVGTVCTIQANLGVAPWDVLHIGLSKVTPLSIGVWSIIVGVFLVGITCWMDRRIPRWGTVLNMICFGLFLDLIMFFHLIPQVHEWWSRILLLIIGICLLAFGAGLYMSPKAGAGPRDGLMMALSKQSGWSIRRVRTIMELTVGMIGWLLGGPVHIGTLFFCFLTGPIMQFSIHFCDRILQTCLKRGVIFENIHERPLRAHNHDGTGNEIREGSHSVKKCC